MKSMGKTISYVMVIMIFSRLLAFISNLVYVTHFGANTRMDIFSFSQSLPNIIFASFGTALTTVVIPIFASYLAEGKKEKASAFADNILTLSLAAALILAIIAAALSPALILLTRFRNEEYWFAVTALCIMMPVMVFYALNYVLQGILQSYGKFAMTALVSAPGSLIVIAYVLLLGDRFGVTGLLFAVFAGLASQGLVLIIPARKAGYSFKPSFGLRNEDIRKAMKLIPPVLVGTSAYQVNMLYNNILASRFETANTIMYTIQNIVLYSVLAFIYSVTAVVYPKLSMLAAQKDIALFKESLIKILKTVSFFMVPAAFGFILLNRRMADVFLAWNRITPDNLDLASGMMAFYAAGVIGLGIKEVLDRAFWSLQDTKRPAINSITMMAVNIVISLAAIQFIGPLGIPLAYTVSSLTGGIILVIMMRNKIGPFGIRSLVMSAAKSFLSGIAMTAAVLFVNKLTVDLSFSGVFTDRMMKLLIPTATGIMVYFPAAFLMKSEEAVGIFNKMKNLILPGRKAA